MVFFSKNKPKIKVESIKKDSFSGWFKCTNCDEMVHLKELQENLGCCPRCEYHYRLSVEERIDLLIDKGTFEERFVNIKALDPLNFSDTKPYKERLQEAQEKTKKEEGITVGIGKIENQIIAIAIMDFSFMGGSMGSVVGEKLTRITEEATKKEIPLIVVSCSGGARMQESIFSLMQMAKTSAALTKLHKKRIPYISILTNPTTGGVIASFASLGDIILAEPDALIAFTGPRVIEQTIGQKLPKGAQKSEFLLKKGMIDLIVKRQDLKKKLAFFIQILTNNEHKNLEEKMTEKLKDFIKFTKIRDEQTVNNLYQN